MLNSNIFDLYKYFIFDFDGIIKESVDSKKKAYSKLFAQYKFAIDSIESHHLQNGGLSRYEKIPLYIKYCKLEPTPKLIDFYLKEFSNLAIDSVLNSKWVPGILPFLKEINKNNSFIVSATPHEEIKKIVTLLGIDIPIENIYGSPKSKIENINNFFIKKSVKEYIFFGDAISDSEAAAVLSIDFAYRTYVLNSNQKPKHFTYQFSDFTNELS